MKTQNIIILIIVISVASLLAWSYYPTDDWVKDDRLTSQYNAYTATYENGNVQCLMPDCYWTVYTKESEDYVKVCDCSFEPGTDYAFCDNETININMGVITNWADGFTFDVDITSWIGDESPEGYPQYCIAYSKQIDSYTSVRLYTDDGLLPHNYQHSNFIAAGIFFGDHIEFCGNYQFPWK